MTRITGTLHEDQFTFLVISHSSILRMRNVSDKICAENQNTHVMFNNIFFRKSCPLFDNVKKKIVELTRPQTTIWRMRVPCGIPKAKNITQNLQYLSFSTAKVVERTCLIVRIYIHCLSWYIFYGLWSGNV